jgi:hypothetical protein
MNLNFKERTDRQYKWEMYRSPQMIGFGELWTWCGETFGPLGGQWDSHGGWIKLRGDKELMMFTLRWA